MDGEQDPLMEQAAQAIWEMGEERLGRAADRQEALERARAASPPETAALRHGGYVRGIMRCNHKLPCWRQCMMRAEGQPCPLEEQWCEQQRPRIVAAVIESGHDPELYGGLIDDALISELRYRRIQAYEAVMGTIDAEAAAEGTLMLQPAVASLDRFQRMWFSALEALILTPAARTRLEASRRDDEAGELALAIIGAQERARRGKPMDVEFEVEDDERSTGDECSRLDSHEVSQ